MPAPGIQHRSAVPSRTDASVDAEGAIWHPSPNCGPRRDGLTPSLVVVHYTAMQSAEAALERLCDPAAEVSAHYLIGQDGTLWQMVREADRAWHAGAGEWHGRCDINSRSVGIELDNRGDHPFAEPQMATLERLLPQILSRWGIASAGVIGHSDMAPGRKFDPGPRFDWQRLEQQGLAGGRGHDCGPQNAPWDVFRALAQRAGFTADVDDATLLSAVRLRYRPWGRGTLAPEDFSPLGQTALWT
ncbi:N-acetylmuramoyl-L-alanine amidase AmiD precursor [Falsiruegeria litorea R37]|uniref:N-acetylmuramoyl-L-alanine amidase n=1 Tax=Falsiruegeria litorea R37 TaxID=1200284 RepID=A0A1Y5S2N0_9RHOB|nr:N-acetylmuramoyl-L-alanine amidase [Falsiruegeria litorea]SLN31318.1 N-acetylmuramoyl-L-alanine amidase AmiD precursor [Falsiruegeria litorea R37]